MTVDEEIDEEAEESVEEWRDEAGKWKQKAAEAERAAAENAGAAARLAELEKSTKDEADQHADELKATKAEAEQAAKTAEERGEKTAAEWREEAEKWKHLSQRNEQLAKQNLAAAKRLERLEADTATATTKATKAKAESDAKTAETKADLEAKATQAELKAMRLAVAQELRVPNALIDLLSGSSKREIEQSADRLLRELAANKAPEPETVKAAEVEKQAKEDGELAEARKLLAEAEVKALRLEVATDKQLPSGLAEMLNARTREDLERQADALLSAIGGVKSAERSTRARMPTERLRSGALPEGVADSDVDPGKLADSILRRSRGY